MTVFTSRSVPWLLLLLMLLALGGGLAAVGDATTHGGQHVALAGSAARGLLVVGGRNDPEVRRHLELQDFRGITA
jgi:hypothetical protein